jgi:hypothetical protein
VADGYQVDLAALNAAADGIVRTVGQVDAHPIASLSSTGGALGHERLAGSVAAFGERWQAGVHRLVDDGRVARAHLAGAAAAYGRTEAVGRDGFDGVLREPGPDPGPR